MIGVKCAYYIQLKCYLMVAEEITKNVKRTCHSFPVHLYAVNQSVAI